MNSSATEGRTRLALVGAPSIFRDGLRALLGAVEEFLVVSESPDMDEAVHAAGRSRADVIVIDAESVGARWMERLPDLAGLPAGPAPRLLLLIASPEDGEDDRLARAASLGVCGWVLKGEETATNLISAVQAVSAGDAWLSPPVARHLLERLHCPHTCAAPAAPEAEQLSARERGVLRLVAQGRSNAEIAEALVLAETTVKTHVSRLLVKLQASNRVQLAAFAYRNGLAE